MLHWTFFIIGIICIFAGAYIVGSIFCTLAIVVGGLKQGNNA